MLYPSDKGNLLAFSTKDGSLLWAHKIALALVNPLEVWTEGGARYVLASTMDGAVTLMTF